MDNETKCSKTIQFVRELCKVKTEEKILEAEQTPRFHYEFIESEKGEQGLNTAFDILFTEVFNAVVEKYD